MLNNLKAELIRQGLDPKKAISKVLKCTEKTANNKLSGKTDFSVNEAIKIIDTYFENNKNLTIRYLFESFSDRKEQKGA